MALQFATSNEDSRVWESSLTPREAREQFSRALECLAPFADKSEPCRLAPEYKEMGGASGDAVWFARLTGATNARLAFIAFREGKLD